MLLPLCRCCKTRKLGDSEHQLSEVYLLGAGTPSSIKSFPAESLFLEAQILPQSATAGQTSRSAAEATFDCKPHAQTDVVKGDDAFRHVPLAREDWQRYIALSRIFTKDM